jgi:hypothetical protein
MTFEQWQAAVLPKVTGTWSLHETLATQNISLDFFVLLSSIAGLGGNIGQANYAAANTFLDAFVQYRHSLGLPASVIDIGAMGDVGFLSENRNTLESLRSAGQYIIDEQSLLDSLHLMINRSKPPAAVSASNPSLRLSYVNQSQVGIGIRSTRGTVASSNRTAWLRDPRFAIYHNLEFNDASNASGVPNSGAGSDSVKQFLYDASTSPRTLETSESQTYLAIQIATTLFSFTMRGDLEDGDLSVPLRTLGVDSLISIELRTWLKRIFGVEFTVLEIVGSDDIMHLGRQAAMKLLKKYQVIEGRSEGTK